MAEHLEFLRVDVVDDIFTKVVEEVDGYSAYPTEGLEDAGDLPALKPLSQVKWDGLGNYRIPALLIDPDALLESGEEVVALIEVPIQFLGNAVPFLHRHGAVIIAAELKVFGNDLEVAAQLQQVIILPEYLTLRVALNTK